MTFGVTEAGFVRKRLADCKAELETEYRSTFGNNVDLSSTSPFGQQIGIHAEREAKIWELAEDVYNSAYPDTAEGVSLDNVVAISGISRLPETYSTAIVTLFGEAGTVVPQGSVVSVDGNASARFVTDEDAEIEPGTDAVQHIAFSGVPASGAWTLSIDGDETESLAYDANAAAVQAALRELDGYADVTVSGNYTDGFDVTFAGEAGEQPQPLMTSSDTLQTSSPAAITITITEETEGVLAQVDVAVTAEEPGPVQAPDGSLTVIETPIFGWDSASNAEDAEVGRATETDAELKARRNQSLQKAGAGTVEAIRADLLALEGVTAALVIENATNSVDGDGRPAKSFECIVEGGVDAEIAQTIWEDKPAGIETYGSETETVTDSQGFDHTVKFSRPTPVEIWVEVDITPNEDPDEGDVYPSNGDALVTQAILDFGAALTIGRNVIVNPKLIAAIGNAVAGINDLAIRIGTAADPTLDNNIAIGATERSDWSASRITVDSEP